MIFSSFHPKRPHLLVGSLAPLCLPSVWTWTTTLGEAHTILLKSPLPKPHFFFPLLPFIFILTLISLRTLVQPKNSTYILDINSTYIYIFLETPHHRNGWTCLQKLGDCFQLSSVFLTRAVAPAMERVDHSLSGELVRDLRGSPSTPLLDRVQSVAIRLINSPSLAFQHGPFLSLFYKHFFGFCSRQLPPCVISLL